MNSEFSIITEDSYIISIYAIDLSDNIRLDSTIFQGLTTLTTIYGQATFTNLLIINPGDFTINAESLSLEQHNYLKVHLEEMAFIDLIIINIAKDEVPVFETVYIIVTLISENSLFLELTEVVLDLGGASAVGNTYMITSTGKAVMDIYFENTGHFVISATTSRSSENVFVQSGKITINPENNFNNSDIKSFFGEYNKSIIVQFSQNTINSAQNCINFVRLPEAINEFISHCYWTSHDSFTLKASHGIFQKEEIIIEISSEIKPENYLYNIIQEEIFKIKVENIYGMPQQINGLSYPFIYPLNCLKDDPVIKYLHYDADASYSWIANSSSLDITTNINSQTTSILKIPKEILIEEELGILAKKNTKNTEEFTSISVNIIVSQNPYFDIGINYANELKIKTSQALSVKIQLLSLCNYQGKYTYSWNYKSKNPLNFTQIQKNSPRDDILNISPYTLSEGKLYSFQAKVDGNGIFGETYLNINVKSSKLIMKLNCWGGTIGNSNDFELAVHVIDPDSPGSIFSIKWKCFEESNECLSLDGKVLFANQCEETLLIEKDMLKNNTAYLFTVFAENESKSDELSIRFIVDNNIKATVYIDTLDEFTNNKKPLNIIPKIYSLHESTFNWYFFPEININNDLMLQNPFLSIDQVFFMVATNYKITLTIKDSLMNEINISTFISRQFPPTCNNFTAEKSDSLIYVEANNCSSTTEILLFQFGLRVSEKKIYWLTASRALPSCVIHKNNQASKAVMRLCDDYDCNLYETNIITTKNVRYLSIANSFTSDIANLDNIPDSVVYYSQLAENQKEYSMIVNTFYNYMMTETVDEFLIEVLITCLEVLLGNENYADENTQEKLFNATAKILNEYKGALTDNQFQSFTSIFSPYISPKKLLYFYPLFYQIYNNWIKNQLPGKNITIIQENLSFYCARVISKSMLKKEIKISSTLLTFSNKPFISDTAVFDIFFILFSLDYQYIYLKFINLGSYTSYTLALNYPQQLKIESSNNPYIKLLGSYTSKDYKCQCYNDQNQWKTSGCEILQITSNYIELNLTFDSYCRIYFSSNKSCNIGTGPILTTSIFIMVGIAASFGFYIKDLKVDTDPSYANLWIIFPYSSLLFKQTAFRRNLIVLQLLCNYLILICLIGAFLAIFQSPTKSSSINYGELSPTSLLSGLVSWLVLQVVVIPCFIRNQIIEKYRFGRYTLIAFWSSGIVTSIVGVSLMTSIYCSQYTFDWVVNIFIFIPIQIFTELGYARLSKHLQKAKEGTCKIDKIEWNLDNTKLKAEINKINS